MAVGMTLNQLYAHPTYADHASAADGSGAGPAPSSSSASSATATSSSASTASSSSDPVTATPPTGRSPGSYAKPMNSKPVYGAASQQMEPRGYPPMPTAYAPYPHAGYPRGNGSEEYMADPLPFEYNGMRRFHPGSKDAQERMLPAYPDAYTSGSSSQHHPVYTTTSVSSDRGQIYSTQQAYDPRAQYAPEIPGHYQPGMPRPSPYNVHNPSNPLMPLTHAFPPLLDPQQQQQQPQQHQPPPHLATKKEVDYAPTSGYMTSSSAAPPSAAPSVPVSSGGAAQEAMIKVKTPLKLKYWRNGRRNLQCFPSCKVFGDYSAIKIEDLKQHDFMWGKCRGSIVTEVTLNSNVAFDDLVILGRVHSLENIPVAFEEAVIRECMLGRMVEPDVMDAMKDQWITGERLPDFVQQDAHVACYEFKPKVWKYTEDMAQGKCKRRNVKYYVQFEAFVLVMSGDRRYYACIGSGMSTSFEVGSSRVLARQKRKAANTGSASASDKLGGSVPQQQAAAAAAAAAAVTAADMQQMHQQMHQQQMMPHGMMQTHPMAGVPMYPSPYHQQQHPGMGNRGLPPTFPQMMGMPPQQMHEMQHQSPMLQQQQAMASPPSTSVGGKRKLSSERPPFPTDRAPKMLKTVGVAQSVPM